MKCFIIFFALIVPVGVNAMSRADVELYPEVARYSEMRIAEFDQIPADRKLVLEKVSAFIRSQREKDQPARLIFVCTHNSRRSHLAQIWAQAAAAYYRIPGVEASSGGTEATAFNPRAIAALERCGIQIRVSESRNDNPRYSVTFDSSGNSLVGFSKVYNEPPNPTRSFCAVMTCTQADESCPVVPGCDSRIAVPYEDPKVSDNSPEESETYDLRCRQIAREMFYVMSRVR